MSTHTHAHETVTPTYALPADVTMRLRALETLMVAETYLCDEARALGLVVDERL